MNTKVHEINIHTMLSDLEAKNIHLNRVDMKKILAYSAIKIIANPTDPYSTLKPDTSSDSPSEKSNGVRLVSATQQINQTNTRGKNIKTLFTKIFNLKNDNILNLWAGIR